MKYYVSIEFYHGASPGPNDVFYYTTVDASDHPIAKRKAILWAKNQHNARFDGFNFDSVWSRPLANHWERPHSQGYLFLSYGADPR